MTNTQTSIRATIGKHQRVIMLTVAIVALAAYIVPFAHLYDVADAASKYKDKNKKNSHDPKKKDSKKDPRTHPTSVKASIAQKAVLNSGIFVVPGGGGGSGSGYQGTQTQTGNFFSFTNQQANICSGTATCSNTLTISNLQYGPFGGAT
jgi:hypothetical protein